MAEDNKAENDANSQPQPGQVVTPGGAPAAQSETEQAAPLPQIQPAGLPREESQRVVASLTHEAPPPPLPEPPKPEPKPEPAPEPIAPPPAPAAPVPAVVNQDDGSISWTAAEFVAHEKSAGWYMKLALVAIAMAAIIFLLTRDPISTAVVPVAALFLGILAGRHPKHLQYRVGDDGISVGNKHYALEEFRSFSVAPEGALLSIVLMPLKRFAPLLTIYCAPEDEDKIASVLSGRLPYEEHKADVVEQFMRRIHF